LALRKSKINFFCQEKENTPNQHCLPSQDVEQKPTQPYYLLFYNIFFLRISWKLEKVLKEKEKKTQTNSTLPANQIADSLPTDCRLAAI
jgi:hypothetical protein